jgi:hypothetical protein
LWPQLAKLQPSYIVVDEGGGLGSKDGEFSKMVEKMKAGDTITWVISATPFKESGQGCKLESELLRALVPFDAITQKREPYKTMTKRLGWASKLFGGSLAEASASLFFVIRHSDRDIADLVPNVKFIEVHTDAANRGKQFLALVKKASRANQKLLLAGVTPEQRKEVGAMLKKQGVPYCCLETSGHNAVKEFANPSTRVLLMSDNLKLGIDNLKVAQKVVFWDENHADCTNPVLRKTIIKRVCRLGCVHKEVEVVTYHFFDQSESDQEGVPVEPTPARRARVDALTPPKEPVRSKEASARQEGAAVEPPPAKRARVGAGERNLD